MERGYKNEVGGWMRKRLCRLDGQVREVWKRDALHPWPPTEYALLLQGDVSGILLASLIRRFIHLWRFPFKRVNLNWKEVHLAR